MSANGAEVVAGALLLFFVPGYTVAKATFPEWRIRGEVATLRLLEIVTLSFVTSLGFTILVGYGLLAAGPSGFQAVWSDPLLEAFLAGIAVVGFGVGWFRRAYARDPPHPTLPEPTGDADTWRVVQQLDQLRREERRVRHGLRQTTAGSPEATRLRSELDRIEAETTRLRMQREEEYAE